MLSVLRHHDLEGVMASVVRYFGGVKLGAGGLVRAYTQVVAQAVAIAEKRALVPHTPLACCMPYTLEDWVRRELAAVHAPLSRVTHSSLVCLHFSVPQTQACAVVARLNAGGRGQLLWLDSDALA